LPAILARNGSKCRNNYPAYGFNPILKQYIYETKTIIMARTRRYLTKTPNSPKKITWLIGLLFGIAGIIGHYGRVPVLTENNYILLLIGFLTLAAGTTFRDI
jgi:uncharacterized membrane protein HdeD (DUF308 family)